MNSSSQVLCRKEPSLPAQLVLIRHHSSLRVVSETEALAALSAHDLALPRRDVVIDTRPFAEDTDGGRWRASHAYIREQCGRVRDTANADPNTRLVCIGLPEVPHAIAQGAYLGDETPIVAFDYDRFRDSWNWPEERRTLALSHSGFPLERITKAGAAVLRVEMSYSISDTDVDAVVSKDRLADIRIMPMVGVPKPGLVQSLEDVAAVRTEVREALAALDAARPEAKTVHLLVAASPSVCIAIGQELRLRNGPSVQTYRYRAGTSSPNYRPALLLTPGELSEAQRPLSTAEVATAGQLRQTWQEVLTEIRQYTAARSRLVGASCWYSGFCVEQALKSLSALPGVPPISAMVKEEDRVALEPRSEEYAFDKDHRLWRFSDQMVLCLQRAVGGDDARMRSAIRLFFFHEYLHDWQDLTKYTARDVGSFANCLERIDYIADAYASLHQLDFVARSGSLGAAPQVRTFLADQIDLVSTTFWAFEPAPPHPEWQERRLRRYLNWFWRRVQTREAREDETALMTLLRQPSIEIAGLEYRVGEGRVYVRLDRPRPADVLEIGLVLEDGRFYRRGSTADLRIEDLLMCLSNHDHEGVRTFFNGLYEHVAQTSGALPVGQVSQTRQTRALSA